MSTLFNDSPECRALPYYFTALEAAVAFDAFQKRMAKEYPGAWPWMESIPNAKGDGVQDDTEAFQAAVNLFPKQEPKPQHFDTEAHRNFMRSLG
jgi:hypothetical protein